MGNAPARKKLLGKVQKLGAYFKKHISCKLYGRWLLDVRGNRVHLRRPTFGFSVVGEASLNDVSLTSFASIIVGVRQLLIGFFHLTWLDSLVLQVFSPAQPFSNSRGYRFSFNWLETFHRGQRKMMMRVFLSSCRRKSDNCSKQTWWKSFNWRSSH